MSQKLEQILYFPKHGIPIFPVAQKGKVPIPSNGFKSATTNKDQVIEWFEKHIECNWAIPTGERLKGGAGILALDIDLKSGGFETWKSFRSEFPEPIVTIIVETGGGGQHLWFIQLDGCDVPCGTNVLGPGIDVRANGGYILVPPSVTEQTYKFRVSPQEVKVSDLPEWLYELIVDEHKEYSLRGKTGYERIPQGQRHQTLLTAAGSMRRVGLTSTEIIPALQALKNERFEIGDHPVTAEEIKDVADWIVQKPRAYAFSDLGNAERLTDLFGHDIRFSHERRKWLIWDSIRWAVDSTGMVMRMGFETVRTISAEAAGVKDNKLWKEIMKWALQSENRSRIEAMISLAQSLPSIPVKSIELDQHPHLLNCLNGMVDLRTRELLPHGREYLITKHVPVDYNPRAKAPKFHSFLDLITDSDAELQEFLQIAVGYSITGRTDEQVLFFMYGTGSNGKTTFCEAIRRVLVDYAVQTDIEALLRTSNRGHGASPYVALLAGSRFALGSEIPEGKRLNESLVKSLVGGDAITARYLHANPFTFEPTHKLWLFGNFLPKVSGTDWGFWRRIRVIPFKITIPEDIRRPLTDILDEFSNESQGILAWAVAGAKKWFETGLPLPKGVQEATAAYKSDQDIVQHFLDECCDQHPEYRIGKDEIFTAFKEWCHDTNERDMNFRTRKWFTRQLVKRGFEHGGPGRSQLRGIRLRLDNEQI